MPNRRLDGLGRDEPGAPRHRFDERHAADAEHTHADVSKARELLGYEPTHDICEGVRAFVDWYRANRDWYEPLVRSS
jgi:UDP-glucose 4-epimerase